MKKYNLILIFCLLILQCKKKIKTPYTKLPVKSEIDTLFGVTIEDSYRYIENISDTVALNWYKEQTEYSKTIFSKIVNKNKITKLQEQIESGNNVKTSNISITLNNKYFYLKTDSSNSIKRLFYKNSFDGEELLLFDPTELDKANRINYINPNSNGSKIVIGLTKNDLEIGDVIILDVSTKKQIDNTINNCWPSALGGIRWLPDSSGFTYEYIPNIDKKSKKYLLNIKTLLHLLGTNPKTDKLLLSKEKNPEINIKEEDFPEVSFKDQNSKYMFASISGASYYADYYYSQLKNIVSNKIKWDKLFTKEDLIKQFHISDNNIIFLTAKNAQNFKICKTNLLKPDFKTPEVLVSEDSVSVITDFAITNKGVFYVKTKNGVDAQLLLCNQNKKITEIPIPKKAGNINVFSKGDKYDDLWIVIRGWTSLKEQYKFNYSKNKFEENQLYINSNYKKLLSNTTIEEIEIMSHDNVKVPLSIIYKEGTKLDGDNSVLIRCYGALGISFTPKVNNYLLHWINNGGIYVVAHTRGGGEKGDAWHKAGFKGTKPNSWKDLIACSEYLIENKYTSSKKIAISSASGGGILIGNAIAERPDLYGAAIVTVGVFNTLRSEFAPNGKNLSKEFGSINDSIEFKGLLEMDSYNKIKVEKEYPAVFLTAGINDSRVVVWQPAKFAARIKETSTSNKPILFSVNFEGGHGFDASKETKNEELANLLSFAFWQTGHPDFQNEKVDRSLSYYLQK